MWTKKAAAHLVAATLCVLVALVVGSLVMTLVGLTFLTALVIGYLTQRSVSITSQRELSSTRVREDDEVQANLALRSRFLGTGFVEVRDRLHGLLDVTSGSSYRLMSIPGNGQARMDYEIKAPFRGVYSIGPVEVRKSDVFQMFQQVSEVPASIDGVTVLPRAEEFREVKVKALTPKILSGPNPVRQPGIGSQFYALREYTSSDPMKDVNWKASARAGELIVNQWERESISVVTMFLDTRLAAGAGTLGHNPLMYSARAAASMTEYFMGERSTIRFVTYGDGVHTIQPDSGERQQYKIYERLAEVAPEGDMPLRDAVLDLIPRLETKAPILIFTSGEEDDSVVEAVTMLMARQMNVTVILPAASEFQRMADDGGPEPAELQMRRLRHQMLVKRLRGLGIIVVDWDPTDRMELALMGAMAVLQ